MLPALLTLALTLALQGSPSATTLRPGQIRVAGNAIVGNAAPPLQAPLWLNHVGQVPSLQAFRGKTLLLEFWATW